MRRPLFVVLAAVLMGCGGSSVVDVVGMDLEEALQTLEEAGFTNVRHQFVSTPHDDPEGTVVGVTPEPRTRAESGDLIRLQVAKAHNPIEPSGEAERYKEETSGGSSQRGSSSGMSGYGPCIEAHRDDNGDISVEDVETCMELHLGD